MPVRERQHVPSQWSARLRPASLTAASKAVLKLNTKRTSYTVRFDAIKKTLRGAHAICLFINLSGEKDQMVSEQITSAKLLATGCEGLASGRSCRHFNCVIDPEAERI